MIHSKFGPGLLLDTERFSEAQRIPVFIVAQSPMDSASVEYLKRFGTTAKVGSKICTANLSPADLGSIADQPWVKAIAAAERLRAHG